jgi:hypothetical protein
MRERPSLIGVVHPLARVFPLPQLCALRASGTNLPASVLELFAGRRRHFTAPAQWARLSQ